MDFHGVGEYVNALSRVLPCQEDWKLSRNNLRLGTFQLVVKLWLKNISAAMVDGFVIFLAWKMGNLKECWVK
jgi:hypothetical protein